ALYWLKRYLETRKDLHPGLFASAHFESRLSGADIWRPFNRYRRLAGLNKPVRPHLLRHTAATQLLFNGWTYKRNPRPRTAGNDLPLLPRPRQSCGKARPREVLGVRHAPDGALTFRHCC